ncbi:hypothetical protein ACFL1B_04915 [Nanoarchaeota archaeon]
MKLLETKFLKVGAWIGKYIVNFLEFIIPGFKNKEQDKYGFRDPYLEKFNLSNRERFKRNFKVLLIALIMIVIFFYLSIVNLRFSMAKEPVILIATAAMFIGLFFSAFFYAHKETYKE